MKGVRGRVGGRSAANRQRPDGFILGPGDDKANELDVVSVRKGLTEPPSGFRYSGRLQSATALRALTLTAHGPLALGTRTGGDRGGVYRKRICVGLDLTGLMWNEPQAGAVDHDQIAGRELRENRSLIFTR